MMRKRASLRLEQLEDRTVPSLTASFVSGSLYLSGTPMGEVDIVGNPGTPGTYPNTFTVTDNSHSVGRYNITGNLLLNLTNEKGNININLNGGFLPGNVAISLNNGYVVPGTFGVNIFDGTGAFPPTSYIGGSVTITGGNGEETYNVGVSPGGLEDPININNNLTIAAAGSSFGSGDVLNIGDGTTIFGTVSTSQVDQVGIGSGTTGANLTTIGGNLSINDAGALVGLKVDDFGVVDGSVNVTGTNLDDSFALQAFSTGGGQVGGNLNVNLNQGQTNGDQILLGPKTVVGGNALLAAGGNLNNTTGDQFRVLGSIFGNATVNMGNSTNSLYFSPQNVGDPTPFVGGTMTVTAGNGTNYIGITGGANETGPFAGMIQKGLSITLGTGNNGSSSFPMTITSVINTGQLTWRSGNGQDFVQLGDVTTGGGTSVSYTVNMQFGNKDDTLIVDIGAGFIGGTANGGGRVIANTFTLLSGTELPTFTTPNFP